MDIFITLCKMGGLVALISILLKKLCKTESHGKCYLLLSYFICLSSKPDWYNRTGFTNHRPTGDVDYVTRRETSSVDIPLYVNELFPRERAATFPE